MPAAHAAGSQASGAGHALALDVGGTGIKAGLVTRDGRLIRTWRRATRIERGPQAVIDTIADFAAELVDEAAAEGTPVAAAGFALPGIINERTGVGVFSATVGWRDVPFRDLLGARLAVPVAIGHDVRAGGVAEARIGAGRGSARFVFLPLGTSIGGAIMIDGVPNLGPHGMGGEFGHIVVRPGGLPCGCGLHGCLAQYSSAGAVAARYAAAAGTANTGALDVAARLATGDPVARRIWDEAVDVLADALLTTAALLDPDRVVIGGGLAEAGDTLMRPLAEALAAKATYHALPELVTAELGDLAGCLGAGLLAWDLVPGSSVSAAPVSADLVPADPRPGDSAP
ncbi:ROK family protein [Catenulispora pinistramenti]|uniref:ROK family protein n=1 Tax=Catenulispora pinistramenti TaxID=2705254 RepID=UPI002E77E2E5|nr:ROK family protein [Catenulispora pinistramenti]